MKLEVAIHCYDYQKRLNWMLNSFLQQEGDLPEITINISYEQNNGNPTTEELIKFFTKRGLNIKSTLVESNSSHNRSMARRQQLNESDADWIIFADADMVYGKTFFAELKKQVQTEKFKNETKCIGADRVSLSIPYCINFFDEDKEEYPREIPDVEKIIAEFPVYRRGGKNTAAGYFQLANVKSIRERNLEYPLKGRDGLRQYKADRAFRCVMGGRTGMDLPAQYHLNHSRDKEKKQR